MRIFEFLIVCIILIIISILVYYEKKGYFLDSDIIIDKEKKDASSQSETGSTKGNSYNLSLVSSWSSPIQTSSSNTTTGYDCNTYTFNSENKNYKSRYSSTQGICHGDANCNEYLNAPCFDSDQLPLGIFQTTCQLDTCYGLDGKLYKKGDIMITSLICNNNLVSKNVPECGGVIGFLCFAFKTYDENTTGTLPIQTILGTDNDGNLKMYEFQDGTTDNKDNCIFRIIRYTNVYNPINNSNKNPESDGIKTYDPSTNLIRDDRGYYAAIYHRKSGKILDSSSSGNLILSTPITNLTDNSIYPFTSFSPLNIRWYLASPQTFTPGFLSPEVQRCNLYNQAQSANGSIIPKNQNMIWVSSSANTSCSLSEFTSNSQFAYTAINSGTLAAIPPDFTSFEASILANTAQSPIISDGSVNWAIYDQFTLNTVFSGGSYDPNGIYSNSPQQMIYLGSPSSSSSLYLNLGSYTLPQYFQTLKDENTHLVTLPTSGSLKILSIQHQNDITKNNILPTLEPYIPYSSYTIKDTTSNINYTQFIPYQLLTYYNSSDSMINPGTF